MTKNPTSTAPATQAESAQTTLRVAICVMCHKATPVLEQLIDSLQHPAIDLYVHVDGKCDLPPFTPLEHRARLLRKRHSIQWGRSSQIDAMLALFRATCEQPIDYLLLVSGDSLPLWRAEELLERIPQGEEMITLLPMSRKEMEGRLRSKQSWWRRLYYRFFGLGELFAELSSGPSWVGFSPRLRDWMLRYLEQHPAYERLFKGSFCGDELFFHSLAIRSPYRESLHAGRGYMYTDWSAGEAHPKMLSSEDLESLKAVREATDGRWLFARKFRDDVDLERYRALFLKD